MLWVLGCWCEVSLLWFLKLSFHLSLLRWCLCFSWREWSLNSAVAICSKMHCICSHLAGLMFDLDVRLHWRKRSLPMTNENALITLGWCLSWQKYDLTLLTCIAMLWWRIWKDSKCGCKNWPWSIKRCNQTLCPVLWMSWGWLEWYKWWVIQQH